MKIVNLDEFLKLPANTVFSKYESCCFEDLLIKCDSILDSGDFFYNEIATSVEARSSDEEVELLHNSRSGESFSMDFETLCRDGCFDKDQLFAVWENRDVEQLIERLSKSLPEHYDTDEEMDATDKYCDTKIYSLKRDLPLLGGLVDPDTVMPAGERCALIQHDIESGLGMVEFSNGYKVWAELSNLVSAEDECIATVTDNHLQGVEEMYYVTYECPKCGITTLAKNDNYCSGCGVPLEFKLGDKS
jgi:hypothetical protein